MILLTLQNELTISIASFYYVIFACVWFLINAVLVIFVFRDALKKRGSIWAIYWGTFTLLFGVCAFTLYLFVRATPMKKKRYKRSTKRK